MKERYNEPIRRKTRLDNISSGKTPNKLDNFLRWNRKKFIKFAQIGLILFIFGLLIFNIINILSSIDYGDLREGIKNLFRIIKIIAISLFYVGVLLFILSIFTIALYDEDMHIYLRAALIIALGLIIGIPLYIGPGI
jgi:hypothetical protein